MRLLLLLMAVLISNGAFASMEYQVEKVSTGYIFTEGPVWGSDGSVLFSDIPANKIWKISKDAVVFREPSGMSNGLTFDNQGRLIACEHANRRVTRTEKDGSISVLADKYCGKTLNSPNDVVVKADGSIYFTDPPYGVDKKNRELDFQGVYRIGLDGKIDLLIGNIRMPNGLCFSPDEKRLYIADSSELRQIYVYRVNADGTLSSGRIFAKITNPSGVPDGMKVDVSGRLYVAGPGGVWVFDTDGKHLDTIKIPETPANLAWGGSDGKTLYVTAKTSIYKVKLSTGGIVPGKVKE